VVLCAFNALATLPRFGFVAEKWCLTGGISAALSAAPHHPKENVISDLFSTQLFVVRIWTMLAVFGFGEPLSEVQKAALR
jgi:hypothetical protein